MALSKPYYRIIRPFPTGYYMFGENADYILSNLYASDRLTLIRAYSILEKDLINLFEYIEPSDKNLKTYSHRTYELLLRASTEFEMNCKGILTANGYVSPSKRNLNVTDYHKIDTASKLSKYKVVLDIWLPNGKVFRPFKDWTRSHSLGWYQSYNAVKHNRSTHFEEANFKRVMEAITGLLVILFSQFYVFTLNPYQEVDAYATSNDGSIYLENSLFRVIPPSTWKPSEQYNFRWKALETLADPFDKFPF